MASKTKTSTAPRMSDEAVQAKTGKTWKEWFAILDKAGASKLSHPEIVKYLSTDQGVGPWWQQMVTVTYEQARGLRAKHQKPSGYEISVSRTLNALIAKLFKAFADAKLREGWLAADGLTIRKTIPNKSLRMTWIDGKTSVAVSFVAKTSDKSQVVVQHSKLPNATVSAKMKTYWGKALDRLRARIEK
ncbi:MAG TPA: SRPBCC domain-containing protein [Pyrinomonadaceae bacterium]|nr:SRPBCC domain-containing protein [Pyrinomonadaceae bacterium]